MASNTAIVRVTPISGCRSNGNPIMCTLLEIDEARILLDCGSADDFSVDYLSSLRRHTRSRSGLGDAIDIDLILISHSDMSHIGGLAAVVAAMDSPCPVLTTLPIHHLGLVTLYDAYQGCSIVSGSSPDARIINLDMIDAAFERITMLRYAQSYSMSSGHGRASGTSVVAVGAGKNLGSAIWRIQRHNEDIIYAVDFLHRRQLHLSGASLDALPQRPSLLIGDAKGSLTSAVDRKERDKQLVASVMSAVSKGGTALLPVDSAGSTLEILQVLDQHWKSNGLVVAMDSISLAAESSDSTPSSASNCRIPIVLLGYQARRVLDLARGMLEWMHPDMGRIFEKDRTNPFDLLSVRTCHSLSDALKVSDPKVVLVSTAGCDGGLALGMLSSVLGDSKNAIVFTQRQNKLTPLFKSILEDGAKQVNVQYFEQVPLEGQELADHLEKQREEAELRAAQMAFEALQRQREDADETDDDDEDDIDEDGGGVDGKIEEMQGQLDVLMTDGSQRQRHVEGKLDAVNSDHRKLKRSFDGNAEALINSAAALKHVFWTDYRRDWLVDDKAGAMQTAWANPMFFPLISPENMNNEDGVPLRHQVFPHRKPTLSFAHAASAAIVDDYGEAVDADRDFLSLEMRRANARRQRGLLNDENAASNDFNIAPSHLIEAIAPLGSEESSGQGKMQKRPMKWRAVQLAIAVQCMRRSVDYDVVSDGQALRTIYTRLLPRRLVLLGANDACTDYLYNYFHLRSMDSTGGLDASVFAPHDSECVLLSSAVNVAQVVLGQDLIERVTLQSLKDYELGWVRGSMSVRSDTSMDIDDEAAQPTQKTLVLHCMDATLSNDQLSSMRLLGDIKLGEIRRSLQMQHRITAHFSGGDLICGSGEQRVAIRRHNQTGQLVLEGPICPEYYAVRSLLYQHTALVGI